MQVLAAGPAAPACGTRAYARVARQPVLCSATTRPVGLVRKLQSMAAAAAIATSLSVSPALAAGVSFVTPVDNAVTGAPVHVEFAVDGMEVRPAADGVIEGTGHFHLMVDEPAVFEAGKEIPFDATHLHYGKGQVAADVPLPPGEHKLTLQFANALHQSYGPTFAKTINVSVK